MTHRHVMGKQGLTLAVIASMAMAAVAFFVDTHHFPSFSAGLCFRSPNLWPLVPLWGWIINTLALLLCCLVLNGLNKEFRVVQGSDTVLLGMFLIMAASNSWVSGMLTSSCFLAFANLSCLWVLFDCYKSRNATKEIFIIATILSIGSMFEYAFILMTPVYLLGAILLKCFNIKTFTAFIMGLAAPYWIVLGFGIISPESIAIPHFSQAFEKFATKNDLFVSLLNIAITMSIGLLLALSNSVQLFAGNSKRRIINMVINLLGLCVLLCMIFDFDNITAYLATGYLFTAIQIGNLYALGKDKGPLLLWLLSALYIGGFVLMIAR